MKKEYQRPEMFQEPIEVENNLMVTSFPVDDEVGYDQYSNEDLEIDIW